MILSIVFYWVLLSPTMAALRLLATRVPPDGTPLPTVLASPLPERGSLVMPSLPPRKGARPPLPTAWPQRPSASSPPCWCFPPLAYGLFSLKRGQANELVQMVLAVVVEFAAIYVVTVLWRRGRKHAAIDAHAAVLSDPRRARPLSALVPGRSAHDGDRMGLSGAHSGMAAPGVADSRVRSPGSSRCSRLQPRGDERRPARGKTVAAVVAPIGPFVAIGAPDEPLPQLGAARAYFTKDMWQSAVIEWVDEAQLIVTVAGPTHWIRWELDTILSRNAWPKLIVLMPPSTQEDNAGRWGNRGRRAAGWTVA